MSNYFSLIAQGRLLTSARFETSELTAGWFVLFRKPKISGMERCGS
jgi:hypothetical protein